MSTEPVTTTDDATKPSAPKAPGRTMAALVLDAAERYRGVAMRSPSADGNWTRTSYPQLGADVRAIAKGLIGLGIKTGDRVAILSNTRAEWTLADFGAMCA